MKPKPPKAFIPDVPKGYDMAYLVFQLAEGDAERADYIWDNWTFADCMEWVSFRQYESMVNERVMNG